MDNEAQKVYEVLKNKHSDLAEVYPMMKHDVDFRKEYALVTFAMVMAEGKLNDKQ